MRLPNLAATALWATLVLGPSPATADPAAIQGVIGRQMEAFRADDFATAFTFAAPGIQRTFGGPERFGRMVREGYPMVWRPAEVDYLESYERGAAWLQDVLVTDPTGGEHRLRYTMVETPEGWRIAGVELLASADPAV